MPPPTERHTGIPTGQPNSTALMSWPILLRSSRDGSPFQPFPYRLTAGLCPVKDGLAPFALLDAFAPSLSSDWDCLRLSATNQCTIYGTILEQKIAHLPINARRSSNIRRVTKLRECYHQTARLTHASL